MFNPKKVKGVDATVKLKVLWFEYDLVFGNGSDRVDIIEFDTFASLIKQKPTRTSGNGAGILAFKEMLKG